MKRHLLPLAAAVSAAALALAPTATTQEPARLLRYPHVQGDTVVFTKGGDLWTASMQDGIARRLTSFDEGLEVFGRISPDGKQVAFSGEYGGTRQVFVVPIEGGTPKQLTHYPDVGPMPPRGGFDNLVYDWTPDGRHILIKSNRTPYGQRVARYFLVAADGSGPERPLQIPEGGPATLSPDGSKLAYNIISREWRTWKRYNAGRAQDVHVYDLDANTVEQLTTFDGTDNWPMWLGDRIYFTSDRNGTLNLWCRDLASGAERAVTEYTDHDVLFPARGDTGIVFERGGSLFFMERGSEQIRELTIRLADDAPWTRPTWKDGSRAFGDHSPDPTAKRAVVEFRGDLFLVPAEHGEAVQWTKTPSRRERDPSWSPDGRHVLFLAEHGDRYELYARGVDFGQETRLTDASDAWLQSAQWSPDSSRILCTDNAGALFTVKVGNRERRDLDRATEDAVRGAQWSADGRFVCYTKVSPNGYSAVWIAATEGDAKPVQVTSDDWDDGSPSFDPAGRYLYFVSARDYRYRPVEGLDARLYALLLTEDAPHPLAYRNDLGTSGDAAQTGEADGALRIDFEGIAGREVALPVPTAEGFYGLLGVDGGFLYGSEGSLWHYDLEQRKGEKVLDGVGRAVPTPDRTKLVYRHGGKLCIAQARPGQALGRDAMQTAGIRLRVHPPTEWAQMYGDAWRIMGDFFYDPDMHGVDWAAMRAKYAPLVPHVSHRSDLDFLIGELIGELNCGHTYVQPGETPSVDRVDIGVLGCEFVAEDGHLRITRILGGENWQESTRNPLREPGVDVREGDYLLAIDGTPLTGADDPFRLLEGKAGKWVELTVHDRPSSHGARKVQVRAQTSEVGIRYVTWVQRNRRIVDELSGGRIGYVHAPNTAIDGHRELYEGWQAQARAKDAMIVDDRYNGGGFVPVDMAQAIGQPMLNYWARRHRALAPTPEHAFEGPRVMLINGYSSSGGDAFPYYFRKLGLGTLMGQKTWGGLVGYSGTPTMVDGGGLAVPNFAFVNTDGEWDVEAFGVEPDIEVFDDPTMIQAGREPMLEAAVAHLLEQLEASPKPARPPVPAGPDRRGLVDQTGSPFRRGR
ncbi:MAG: PDZ domain-containing protein [Planctomycetota bacterium]|nr:PDZ domain-containing protein [Planctomycetota bacterium]